MFVAIDRTSKFAIVRLYEQAGRPTAVIFLEAVLEAVPYNINIILTDRAIGTPLVRETMARGIQFAEQPSNRNTVISRLSRFDMICTANEIERRLTKPNHPWTNGQVERMNRAIKEANVKRYHYDDHEQLRRHLDLFIDTYNHPRRLKTLKGLTPAQFIWKEWQARPDLFYEEPCYLTVGLYS